MIQTFTTIAVSIFLEGLFFLLVGVIISSLIEVFVSEETIKKFIPGNKYAALFIASLLGLAFPICECGIVPVIRKLLKKGVPLPICITLLFSSPIVNIVVILSTYFAFLDNFYVVVLRVAGGFTISFLIGLIISVAVKENEVLSADALSAHNTTCSCHGHADHTHAHAHHEHTHPDGQCCALEATTGTHTGAGKNNRLNTRFQAIVAHAIDDFFETGKYFVLGILITAVIQSLVPRSSISGFGSSFPLANFFMIIFPFIISVCSNTDAFIARSFLNQFSISALLCFMIFGAMFDVKTTIMLKKIFRTGFIVRLLLLVMTLTLLFSFVVEFFLKGL